MAAYYITGIAGSGKSTTLEVLREKGIIGYDIDAVPGLCHWRHKKTGELAKHDTGVGKEWIEAHEWLCDAEKLRSILAEHRHEDIVVVGIASNQESFFHYFTKIFLLYCDEQTFLHRLNTRTNGNNFGKDASEQSQILTWYLDFQNRMIRKGAIPVNTDHAVDDVVNEILHSIRDK